MPTCSYKIGTSELLVICTGQGDMVGAKEMVASFKRFCKGIDPKIGKVALGWGAHPSIPNHTIRQSARIRCYNYVSNKHYSPEQMKDMSKGKFHFILTPSQVLYERLKGLGVKVYYYPSATAFKPVTNQVVRSGIGCRCSAADSSIPYVLEPVQRKYSVEYVNTSNKNAPLFSPDELSVKLPQWFSKFKVVLLPLKGRLADISALTSRPLEVAVTGTPFVSSANPAYESMFGEPVPYQSNSPEQTLSILQDIMDNYDKHLEVFARYQKHTLEHNSYDARLRTLIDIIRAV